MVYYLAGRPDGSLSLATKHRNMLIPEGNYIMRLACGELLHCSSEKFWELFPHLVKRGDTCRNNTPVELKQTFEKELEKLINRHSQENLSNTPDFILARYIAGCLEAFNTAVTRRESWYGRSTPLPTIMLSTPVLESVQGSLSGVKVNPLLFGEVIHEGAPNFKRELLAALQPPPTEPMKTIRRWKKAVFRKLRHNSWKA
jgi:hypothetical protein